MIAEDRARRWDLAYQAAYRDQLQRLTASGMPWRKADLAALRHAERVVNRAIYDTNRAQARAR